MTITETIAELERQLAAGELSDDDALRLQDLQRQLTDAFASVRMGDDEQQGRRRRRADGRRRA